MTIRKKQTKSEEGSIETFLGIVTTRVRKEIEEEKKRKKQSLEEYLKSLGYTIINRVGDYVLEVQDSTKTRHYLCIFDVNGKPCMFHTWSLIDMARHVEAVHRTCDKKLAKEIAKLVKEGTYDIHYIYKTLPPDTVWHIKRHLEQ